ncbi:MAG TPA: hypothetical protein VMQ60_05475 [Acidobacteriaceae bacterium]|nr:hypothetical protein [Acidobacteriaceae bacterium]
MRYFPRMSMMVAACFLLTSGSLILAQRGGGGGQMGDQGGRSGGGGVPMGQMSQQVQGSVTAVTSDKLTLQTGSGDSYDVIITGNSRVMKSGQAIKLSDVTPGDIVAARGTLDAVKKTVQAMVVNDVDMAMLAKAMENMGKTYIIGRVSAIDADNHKLTVLRSDNVSQVIAVDDGTSIQRGTRGVEADTVAAGALSLGMNGGMGGSMAANRGVGGGRQGGGAQAGSTAVPESIALNNIKVGDSVMGTGALKSGAFTVMKLGVSEQDVAGGT